MRSVVALIDLTDSYRTFFVFDRIDYNRLQCTPALRISRGIGSIKDDENIVIVAVGLDSNEKDNPPIKFLDVFKKARNLAWKLTMHCDVNQQDSIKHIRQCLYDVQIKE